MDKGINRAGVVPLSVVSVKKPGVMIVRAMSPFATMQTLVRNLLPIVGVIHGDLEWTGYKYEGWPYYVIYGACDLPDIPWPTGIFRFDHKGNECYGPAIRLGDIR